MTEAPQKKLSRTLQENVITALAHNDKAGRAVLAKVDSVLFEGEYRTVAERLIEYWERYDRPPGDHAADLFSKELDDPHHKRGSTYKRILSNMVVLSAGLNPDYVIDSLDHFIQTQSAKINILKAAELLNNRPDDPDALVAARQSLKDFVDGGGDRRAPSLIPSSQFSTREVTWYWRPFFPRRMLSVLSAVKGFGKTSVMLDIAADLSKRKRPKSTIYLAKEDLASPHARMNAAGGDVDYLLFFGKEGAAGEMEHAPPDRLSPQEIGRLDAMIAERGDVGLVCIEPLNSFVDSAKANQDAGIRELLDQLSRLADKHNIMVIVSTHWNKKQDLPARDRIIGSVGVINTARSVNIIIRDPEDKSRNLLVNLVGNYTSPQDDNVIGFRTVPAKGLWRCEWDDEDMFKLDEDEIDAMVMTKGGQGAGFLGRPKKTDAAAAWLKEQLADGVSVQSNMLRKEAERAGFGWRTVEAVKNRVGVETHKFDRIWWWSIPLD